jgi:hypothetical protein
MRRLWESLSDHWNVIGSSPGCNPSATPSFDPRYLRPAVNSTLVPHG